MMRDGWNALGSGNRLLDIMEYPSVYLYDGGRTNGNSEYTYWDILIEEGESEKWEK